MSDILTVAEHRRGGLRDVSFELISAGRELANETGGSLHVAVIGGSVDDFADTLNREGVDTIHTVDEGDEFNHNVYTQAVEQLYAELSPQYLVTPQTVNAMDYVPAVATELDVPFTTDVTDFEYDDGLTITREFYGGKTEGTVEMLGDDGVITIRPAEWPQTEAAGSATVEAADVDIDESAIRSTVNGFEEVAGGDVDISEAEFIVAIGRGIDEKENLDLIEELAETLDATLAASRPLVDSGWLPKNRQVGQSGKVVTPEVYIAIGISGAVQHVAGMKGSDTIIAINDDPSAPIFDIADYGIVDDLFEVVPELTEQFS
ncbi:electron transfer flavoprotein subunit alpha/FixB family protein [Salinibaculum salinum]|uniref:electron transfer flavoprotein subunit alpha/FixB family protein n=1 Tax=Salinibaculum salinum TaxID=3131996 RepID=UPI0030ED0DF9